MKKTRNIFKRFICLILTSILTFGSYVFPVFAAIPDNDSPDVQAVLDAYGLLETHKLNIENEINTINQGTPSQAKQDAIAEAQEFINEVESVFYEDKLTVKTTQFNVVDVTIDFTLADLGLTDGALKTQVLGDAYKTIQAYALTADYVVSYLRLSDEYTEKLNTAGYTLEDIEPYVEQLDNLEITYDSTSYVDYTIEFAQLLISTGSEENMIQIDTLITNLDAYYDDVVDILKTNLVQMYTNLNNSLNTSLDIADIQARINDAITALNGTTPNLTNLSDEYIKIENEYKALEEQYQRDNPDTSYIDSSIELINDKIEEISNQQITVEQIELIQSMINQSLTSQIKLEDLVSAIDENELFDKLVSGELNYDALDAYVNIYNNFNEIFMTVYELSMDINNSTTLTPEEIDTLNQALVDGVSSKVFGETGQYMNFLNSLNNTSKTEEERAEILNTIDLIEYSLNELENMGLIPSSELYDNIVEEIEKSKEFYNKSCDNTLANLKANDIELDLTQESHKIYVGNDVTKLDLSYLVNNEKATVEVVNPEELKVGSNEVIVRVTAENGEVREYVLEVIRAEKEVAATTTVNSSNSEEVSATQMSTTDNNDSDETVDTTVEEETDEEEKSNTSDSNEKYDEEVEEEKGLNGLTVLLIVVGIALVGFGVYKIFGEKEDQKIERAFSNPQPKKQSTSNKNKNNKRK